MGWINSHRAKARGARLAGSPSTTYGERRCLRSLGVAPEPGLTLKMSREHPSGEFAAVASWVGYKGGPVGHAATQHRKPQAGRDGLTAEGDRTGRSPR